MKSYSSALVCSILLTSSAAFAGKTTENIYIPFGVQYLDVDEHFDIDNTLLLQAGIGYRIDDRWATELILADGDSDARDAFSRDADIQQTRVDLLRFYNGWKGFIPYSVVGIGRNDYDANGGLKNDDSDILNIGAGLLKNLDDRWAARLDLRDIHNLQENQNEYALNLMVQYRLGASDTPVVASAPAPQPTPQAAPAPMKEKLEIRLSVNFDSSSDVVKPEYYAEIKRVADFLKKYPQTTTIIEGHTDNRGDDAYNQDLSERRASAIRTVLVNEHNADASRLKAVGYGESRPIADNNSREGQLQNRRVVATFSNMPE